MALGSKLAGCCCCCGLYCMSPNDCVGSGCCCPPNPPKPNCPNLCPNGMPLPPRPIMSCWVVLLTELKGFMPNGCCWPPKPPPRACCIYGMAKLGICPCPLPNAAVCIGCCCPPLIPPPVSNGDEPPPIGVCCCDCNCDIGPPPAIICTPPFSLLCLWAAQRTACPLSFLPAWPASSLRTQQG